MTVQANRFGFLKNGGEMGSLIASYDWAKSPLGAIKSWPDNLRSSVGLMLRSRFPMLIFWGPSLITFYNDAFRPSLGSKGKHPGSLGQRCEESWAESWPLVGPIINDIMKDGNAVWFEDQKLPLHRDGKMGYAYWTYSFSAIPNGQGEIEGLLVTCAETTKAVENLDSLKENKDELAFAIESAELGTWDLNPATSRFTANARLKEWFGLKPDEKIPLSLAIDVISEADRKRVADAINRSMDYNSGGRYEEVYTIINPLTGQEREVLAKGRAWFGEDKKAYRLNGTLQDITEQMRSRRAIEASESKFRSLIEQAPFATAVYVGQDLIIDTANEAMIKLWGKTDAVLHMPLAQAIPELEGQPFIGILQEVLRTGIAYETKEQSADLVVDGKLQRFWFSFTYKPLTNADGSVYGILNMAADITLQVTSRKELEEAESMLRNAIDLAELGTWSIDLAKGTTHYSERMQQWLGVPEAKLDLETSPRVHSKDRERIGKAILAAIQPGGTGYFNEVYSIVHMKTGQERVIHASGRTLFDEQGRALSLTGTAQDITLQQQLQKTLEIEVQQRTEELAASNEELEVSNEELKRSNEELSQYAYVASHDLQEPLRKIRIFSGMLKNEPSISEAGKKQVEKINDSAGRMSQLIHDLLEFSRLLNPEKLKVPVDLNQVINDVKNDFELLIAEKQAVVEAETLPVIGAVKLQINQLFYNMVSNALKFVKPGVQPHIRIGYSTMKPSDVEAYIRKPLKGKTYYRISISDNGIGFDNKHSEQIFEVFKRLHGKEIYVGSGIGLSMCRRIVTNHEGYLYCESQVDKGSVFHVLLPA